MQIDPDQYHTDHRTDVADILSVAIGIFAFIFLFVVVAGILFG